MNQIQEHVHAYPRFASLSKNYYLFQSVINNNLNAEYLYNNLIL